MYLPSDCTSQLDFFSLVHPWFCFLCEMNVKKDISCSNVEFLHTDIVIHALFLPLVSTVNGSRTLHASHNCQGLVGIKNCDVCEDSSF